LHRRNYLYRNTTRIADPRSVRIIKAHNYLSVDYHVRVPIRKIRCTDVKRSSLSYRLGPFSGFRFKIRKCLTNISSSEIISLEIRLGLIGIRLGARALPSSSRKKSLL
jgi:hypothetical protein